MTQPILFTGRFKKEYEELGTLGMGGFGVVLKARHRTDNTEYAVKQVLIEEGDKLKEVLREVRSHAKLKHQNIVAYNTSWLEEAEEEDRKHKYAWNEDDELSSRSEDSSNTGSPGRYLYIAMELGNETLEKWLREHPKKEDRDLKITKIWMWQLRDGLDYIHGKKMFHRDLKPSNILMFHAFPYTSVLKISDFGLVKASRNKKGHAIVRHTGEVGTELYMAPELIKGERTYNKAVDIYSMGLIFIEMTFPMNWEDKERAFEKLQTGETPEFLLFKPLESDDTNLLRRILRGMTAEDLWNRSFAWYKLDDYLPEKQTKKLFTGRFTNDYEELQTLGSGSFGVVVKARHLTDNTAYAVEKVEIEGEENLDKILREVRSHAALSHENIVAYNASWLEEKTGSPGLCLYIVMELGSETLEKWLREHPKEEDRDLKITQIWIRQLMEGLEYMHAKKKIHRDLKPSNILMFYASDTTVLKISVFGQATVRAIGNMGTELYMAPEVINGEREYNKTADIYSMGLIFIEMAFPMSLEDKEIAFEKLRKGEIPECLKIKDDVVWGRTEFLKDKLLRITTLAIDKRSNASFTFYHLLDHLLKHDIRNSF